MSVISNNVSDNVSVAAVECPLTNVHNRPSVAGAVVQTPLSLVIIYLLALFLQIFKTSLHPNRKS